MSEEKTFRAYSQQQGKEYAQLRLDYNESLYQAILDFQKAGSGQFDTLIDIGCGPGTAVRHLAPNFKNAFGLDPSEGMIGTARSLSTPEEGIRFEVSSAETLGSELETPIPEESVDVITAATCAHWFDMPNFWKRAAKVLKPGGTVAFWTGGALRVDKTMTEHVALQAVIDELDEQLEDYLLPGNWLTRDLYRRIPLPWTCPTPVPEFDESSFKRLEWNTGPVSPSDCFFAKKQPLPPAVIELMLGTASPVTRWREAHPEAVGTEQDVLRIMRRKLEKILYDSGVEEGKELVHGDMEGALLLVRKKST
ncbi:hypothetical protein CEP51_002129 [Fusarium floridanum]|uniref:Methyltransferase type 11 domain-containing protein n=1 Tax=Fusarium floridanum TaxID=1325733 RepID=A0A428SCU5_9HYPO|nr:hypothetical protein CEP51_002129 [Fusarium floridanum]